MKVRLLLYLSRRAGWFIGFFSRLQTRALSSAQFHGWIPSDEEATKLARRQFQLFQFNQAKAAIRKLKKSGAQ